MALTDRKASDLVKSHLAEAIKQHIVYDGSERMSIVYTALAGALDGDQCGKTTYQYDGASTRVTGMKEELDVWDSAWDF